MIIDMERFVAILGAHEHGPPDIIEVGLVCRRDKPLMGHTAHDEELLVKGLDSLEYPFGLVSWTYSILVTRYNRHRH